MITESVEVDLWQLIIDNGLLFETRRKWKVMPSAPAADPNTIERATNGNQYLLKEIEKIPRLWYLGTKCSSCKLFWDFALITMKSWSMTERLWKQSSYTHCA